ncbi:MAG: DUF6580 family putative transport protein [Bacteroidota bacterium]
MKKIPLQTGVITLIILAAVASRLVPHPSNFSPLGAIALFGAAHFARRWLAWLIPIAATWLSDLFINNVVYAQYYPEFTWFYSGFYWQYGAYLFIVLLGLLLYKKHISLGNVLGGAIGAGLLFFLISNFGVWVGGTMYPKTFSGLIACYAAGIPFLKGTLMGNLFYSSLLFGSYYFLQKNSTVFQLKHVKYA